MELAIKGSKSTVKVSEAAFDRPYSEALVHQVLNAYLAGARSGTKATKSRSDVRGGGRKPWRQKGTGHARAGTIRSPIWRGGGHTFALRPRDFSQKVNRKMYRGAMQAILSELLRQDRFEVVDGFDLEEPKTKALKAKLADYGDSRVLIITENVGPNLYLASRNLRNVNVIDSAAIDPVSLVNTDKVIATVDAVNKIQEWLG
ncbi:MAG: 50S ribosomal protein L4 [Xanthomonadales bacterium]|nr:50S ribosomal protein L4 [Xanthomonadales bacterium]